MAKRGRKGTNGREWRRRRGRVEKEKRIEKEVDTDRGNKMEGKWKAKKGKVRRRSELWGRSEMVRKTYTRE